MELPRPYNSIISRIFEHHAKIKHKFPEISTGLYVCLVIAPTLKMTKVYYWPVADLKIQSRIMSGII